MFEKLCVVGAGAIGSVIGGYLTRAGHDVTLIDPWAAHVDAMRENGLRITGQSEDFTVPVRAMHLAEACNLWEPFDAAFLCVKSYDTVWATHFILPHLRPSGVVISAQNSINDEWVAPIVGFSRAMGCVITLGAGLYEPGHAVHTSVASRLAFTLGELNGMRTGRVQALAGLMSAIGPTKVTTNLWGERWAKLATNCMANPTSAATGLGSAATRQTPGVVELTIKIASEVVKVGKALGVEVEPINGVPVETYERADDAEAMEELKTRLAEGARQLGEGRPSMLQDVMKGRRTEIDYLNGYVVRKGQEASIPTPVNQAIAGLVRRVERGELKPAAANLRYLDSLL